MSANPPFWPMPHPATLAEAARAFHLALDVAEAAALRREEVQPMRDEGNPHPCEEALERASIDAIAQAHAAATIAICWPVTTPAEAALKLGVAARMLREDVPLDPTAALRHARMATMEAAELLGRQVPPAPG